MNYRSFENANGKRWTYFQLKLKGIVCYLLLVLVAFIGSSLVIPRYADAQTASGEIEGRPAPVSRRQCVAGANAGSLCNQNAECPGSICQDRNVFNVSVAVRFNATNAELSAIENAFTAGSELLFDVTDGQAQFGQVTILNNSTGNRGHYWITNAGGCATDTGSWGNYSGGNINISLPNIQNAVVAPGCVAHEFVHLAFDARDEYEAKAVGCGGITGGAQCPDTGQGANSTAEEACLMECCGRIGTELCWGQAAGDNLAAGNHDATNITEQSRCRSNRSCWAQIGWSWPETMLVPANAPDPGSNGLMHQALAFVRPPANARLVMVLDRSGSMSSEAPTRLERLKTAALDIADSAENGIELGLVSYSTMANDEVAIAALGADRSAYTTAINNLTADGTTNIGDGLKHAYDMIIAAGGVTADTAVILMTDGKNNQPPGTFAADLQQKLNLLLTAGIPVYVTCTGDDGGLDSQCAEIAAGTNGSYVDSAEAADLPNRFVSFYERFKGRNMGYHVSDTFWASKYKYTYPVEVESGAHVTTFAVQWRNPQIRASMVVVDPDGNNYQGRSIPLGAFLRITDPKPGTWTVRLDPSGRVVEGDNQFVVRSFIDNQKINIGAAVQRKVIQPGEVMHICARPLDETPLAGVSISGYAKIPSGRQIEIVLRDDGGINSESGDEFADDGTYCTNFSKTGERGGYTFLLKIVAKNAQQVKDLQKGIIFVERTPTDFERWVELSATVDDSDFGVTEFCGGSWWCCLVWGLMLLTLIATLVLLAMAFCGKRWARFTGILALVVTLMLAVFLVKLCDVNFAWLALSVVVALIAAAVLILATNLAPCLNRRHR